MKSISKSFAGCETFEKVFLPVVIAAIPSLRLGMQPTSDAGVQAIDSLSEEIMNKEESLWSL